MNKQVTFWHRQRKKKPDILRNPKDRVSLSTF